MAVELSETDQIEHDLERTRARMDQRLDALQDKMSPAQIVNDAFSHVAGTDGATFTDNLIARAKANPAAVALVCAGFAWLMMPRRHSEDAGLEPANELFTRLQFAESRVRRFDDEHDEAFNDRLHEARGHVLGIERGLDEPSSSYSERIRKALASARQSVREAAHDAKAGATGTISDARKHFSGNGQHYSVPRNTSLKSNPLALGALAAVGGLIAGSLLRTTELEERTLGTAAGKLKATGRDVAQDLADKSGRVVNQALDTALNSVTREGLTPDRPIGEAFAALKSGELVGSVKQVAADALEAGKVAVKGEAPTRPLHPTQTET
ncbi:DUF3618 domain-containing protein [Sphingomonas xinjiangensis]|uniref:DUF3618 domain-containing protein n=1 Tax=Sphingomonas xinjiangensis TaxID=643568 RepID=A0A840YTM9_9SPHN|nr:DUF3618 domain-containing protein [Sphingomonas xinjiangensis]MBB5713030.1 hypothetical protein [Sphingomonas xinjiangensis]